MKIHLTLKSRNSKTGPIPVSTSSAKTCPDTCPLKKNGCYADAGPLAMHWKKVTEGALGDDFQTFAAKIKALPDGQLWRHNQAGDLDLSTLEALAEANKGKRGFTYTHYAPNPIINSATKNGFTVNYSANNPHHADELIKHGPTVAIIPEHAPKRYTTPGGHKIVTCPAQLSDRVTCATCGLCQKADRQYIIGFKPHGTFRKYFKNRIEV